MTPIEIMALILIVVSAVKILVILVNPRAWNDRVVKKMWANANWVMIMSLISAVVVLYYLLKEITIVQILAVMLFLALFMAVGVATYKKELMELTEKLYKDKTLVKRSSLYILLWVALLAWGALALFKVI